MSDIASYDLSRNVNLTELHLGSNNVADKLDLSKNTKLETLAVCGNFDLTTLDVSNNPGLKHLNISDTDIWSIDVIDCPYIVKAIKNGEKGEGPSADGEHSFIFYEYGEDEVAMFFAFNEGATVKYEKEVPSPTSEPTKIPTQTPTATPTTKPSPTATKAPAKAPAKAPTKAPSGKVSISLNKTSAMIKTGGKLQLKAVVKGTSNPVTWKSSNTKVATVNQKGLVTAKQAGAAVITASVAGKSAACKVTVLYKDVSDKSDFWFKPTNYLTEKGVVKGYDGQTKFKPDANCTRAQMVTFLYKYDKYVNGKG